jgi:GNAT superfamily N-acetyltransferase
MLEIRPVESDVDVEAWLRVRRVVLPNESAGTVEQFRARAKPDQLYVLAELDGRVLGSGLASMSDAAGRGLVSPRVLPEARRRGVGTALLVRLAEHATERLRLQRVGAHVGDPGSRAFAERFGFEEIDRQVEQVVPLAGSSPERGAAGDSPDTAAPAGAEITTIAERPDLLEAAYPLAVAGWADFATAEPVTISLEDWLADEATLPGGSFVALVGGEVVGYSGLCRHDDEGVAEDGLTVVRRDWRRRGLALALKRRELAWAAANGYREVVTWTQRDNEGMRAVNESLGYQYRDVSVTMTAALPLQWSGPERLGSIVVERPL